MLEVELLGDAQRTPCMLLLDTSGSMQGAPITALNDGLRQFQTELQGDEVARRRVDVAIITFGKGGVTVVQDFINAHSFSAPTLEADHGTPMGQAINLGLDLIAQRKQHYKNNAIDYTRPWVILITDGKPIDEWRPAASRVRREEEERRVAFFAIGVLDANMSILAEIASPHTPPKKLDQTKFGEFFKWLSASQIKVSGGKVGQQHPMEPTNGWEQFS